MRSPDISLRRPLSVARSGEPGAYENTGSFSCAGTRQVLL